jgi:hypothetical protein
MMKRDITSPTIVDSGDRSLNDAYILSNLNKPNEKSDEDLLGKRKKKHGFLIEDEEDHFEKKKRRIPQSV